MKIPFDNQILPIARCRARFYFLANLYILDTKLNAPNHRTWIWHIIGHSSYLVFHQHLDAWTKSLFFFGVKNRTRSYVTPDDTNICILHRRTFISFRRSTLRSHEVRGSNAGSRPMFYVQTHLLIMRLLEYVDIDETHVLFQIHET